MSGQDVYNGQLPKYPVSQTADALGNQVQTVRLDVGTPGTTSLIDSTHGLPVAATISGTLGTISALPDYVNGGVTLDTQYGSEYLAGNNQVVTATGGTLTFTSAGHIARRGDTIIWFGTGFSANPNVQRTVESVTATTITMSAAVTNTIQSGDSYAVYRPQKIKVNSAGEINITATTLPLPAGASTASLQSIVQAYDGVTGQYYNRCGGYDVDAVDWFPIPTGGYGTYVPVSISTGIYGTGILTSGNLTGAAQTVILNTLNGYNEGVITITGTYSATFAFEALKNSTWYSIPVWRADGSAAAESSSGALVNTSRAWRFNVAGFDTIRVRCSAYTSGTAATEIQMVSFGAHTGNTLLPTGQTTMANSQSVSIASDQIVPTREALPTGPLDGRKIVTTAGTRVALATTTACRKVDIVAETDNTGTIVVGGVTCVASLATRRGYPLAAGDSYFMEASDLANIYIDSTVSGDGVTFVYYT